MTIRIQSTTDTPEQVLAAIGGAKPKEETEADPAAAAADASEQAENEDDSGASEEEQEQEEEAEGEEEADGQDEEEGADEGEEDQPKPKKSRGGFQRKIDKLTGRAKAAERERDETRAELERLKAERGGGEKRQEQAESRTEEAAPAEPNPDDFETHQAYVKALVKWDRENADREKESKQKVEQEQSRRQKNVDAFNASLSEAKAKHKDFEEASTALDDVFLPGHVVGLIYESENGGELSYQLAKHPEELKRICALAPAAAAREMGKFEAKHLSAPAQSEPKKKEPKTTKAPAPVTPVGSKGSATAAKSIYSENLSQKEYERLRRQGKAA